MRPTDENQTGSRRPNLMSSSRRGGGEINILAMLDGQSGKPRRARKLAWIGAGTLLACALAGGLAWLLHAPSGGFDDHRIAADLPDPKPAPALPAPLPASRPEPPRYLEEAPPQGAAIVEQPLHEAADVFPAEMLPEAMKAHGGTRTAMETPATPASVPPAAAKAPSHAAVPRSAASRTASAAPRHEAPARARSSAAAAAKPVQAPTAVDTDVALISAIIQHVNQHGELQENAKSSTKRTPTQP